MQVTASSAHSDNSEVRGFPIVLTRLELSAALERLERLELASA